tara:strand:- start:1277 stop:1558 length:282 start_codon:yes stop_codon:yes gene_type:complete
MSLSKEKIKEFIEEYINPGLAMHNGFITVQDLDEENILYITMGGGCQGCAASKQTMMYAIDQSLKEEFQEIHSIVDVTEHHEGKNPYYKQPSS